MAATYEQRAALGAFGERLAVRALEEAGLEVLDRNWRCARGEIDIVATTDGLVVVCEVKTRRGDRYGSPASAVTRAKTERLYRLGTLWAGAHGYAGRRLRIDVVAIVLSARGTRVEHLPGVS
jgi:putative endonuclease